MDGLEMEIHSPSLRLNIELCGPSHRKTRSSRVVEAMCDEFLREQRDIIVQRTNILNIPSERVVRKVRDVLTSMPKENTTCSALQRMNSYNTERAQRRIKRRGQPDASSVTRGRRRDNKDLLLQAYTHEQCKRIRSGV
jgi:hypothetical protein